MRKIVDVMNYSPDIGEEVVNDYIVDTTGYIDAETQIKRFYLAGVALTAAKQQYFDSDLGEDDLSSDEVDLFSPIDQVDVDNELQRLSKKKHKATISSPSKGSAASEQATAAGQESKPNGME